MCHPRALMCGSSGPDSWRQGWPSNQEPQPAVSNVLSLLSVCLDNGKALKVCSAGSAARHGAFVNTHACYRSDTRGLAHASAVGVHDVSPATTWCAGVYPLVYLPGVIGTFIAISYEDTSTDSNSSTHIEELRAAAISALTAPTAAAAGTALLQATGWSADDRRVFVTGASRDQHQQQLRYVLPVRSLCLARK